MADVSHLGVECAWPEHIRRRAAAPRRRRQGWTVVAALLFALGIWQLGQGFWLAGRTWLANALVARAWSKTLAGDTQARPWPWAQAWPIARLSAPRLGIERYVLAGTGGAASIFGPACLAGTSAPGEAGNSVIATYGGAHLEFLRRLKPGDELLVERADGSRASYRVSWAEVLGEREVWVAKQEGPTRLTLITAYPFDGQRSRGPLRYVVLAFLS